jgi:hypothetical protein
MGAGQADVALVWPEPEPQLASHKMKESQPFVFIFSVILITGRSLILAIVFLLSFLPLTGNVTPSISYLSV